MGPIVRVIDCERDGWALRTVFGLNLFAANGVEMAAEDDPRVCFLHALCACQPCAAQVGDTDFVDVSDTVGPHSHATPYLFTSIGLYSGMFSGTDNPRVGAFFPRVRDPWLGANPQSYQYLIRCDAIALYVGPNDVAKDVEAAVRTPFPGQEAWLRFVAERYALVVVPNSDGWHFDALARDMASFSLLDAPIAEAVQRVESSVWFQDNAPRLQWSDDLDHCLMLPDKRRAPDTDLNDTHSGKATGRRWHAPLI